MVIENNDDSIIKEYKNIQNNQDIFDEIYESNGRLSLNCMVPIMKDKLSKIQYLKDPEIWDNISTIRDRMYHSTNDNMKVIINRNEMLMDKFSMRGLWSN